MGVGGLWGGGCHVGEEDAGGARRVGDFAGDITFMLMSILAKSESVQILQAISGPGNIMWEIWRVSEREVGGEVI